MKKKNEMKMKCFLHLWTMSLTVFDWSFKALEMAL